MAVERAARSDSDSGHPDSQCSVLLYGVHCGALLIVLRCIIKCTSVHQLIGLGEFDGSYIHGALPCTMFMGGLVHRCALLVNVLFTLRMRLIMDGGQFESMAIGRAGAKVNR